MVCMNRCPFNRGNLSLSLPCNTYAIQIFRDGGGGVADAAGALATADDGTGGTSGIDGGDSDYSRPDSSSSLQGLNT